MFVSLIFSVLQWIDNSREAARIAAVCGNHSSLTSALLKQKQPSSGDSSLLLSTFFFGSESMGHQSSLGFFYEMNDDWNYHAWHIDKPICSPCGERALSYNKRRGGEADGVINRQGRETQAKWEKRTRTKRGEGRESKSISSSLFFDKTLTTGGKKSYLI